MSDHVIVATEVESTYSYSKTGKFFAQDRGVSLEQVTALSFAAAATNRVRLHRGTRATAPPSCACSQDVRHR